MPKSVKQIKRMQHTENDRIFYSEFEVDELNKVVKQWLIDRKYYDGIDDIFNKFKKDILFDEVTKK